MTKHKQGSSVRSSKGSAKLPCPPNKFQEGLDRQILGLPSCQRAQGAGADQNPHLFAIDDDTFFLKIRSKGPLGHIVSMTDILATAWPFT